MSITSELTDDLLNTQKVTKLYYVISWTTKYIPLPLDPKPEGFTKNDIPDKITIDKIEYDIRTSTNAFTPFSGSLFSSSSSSSSSDLPYKGYKSGNNIAFTIYGEYEYPIADSIAVAKSIEENKKYAKKRYKIFKKGVSKTFRQAFFHTDNLRIYYKLNSDTGEISIDQISLLDDIDQDTTIGFQFIPLFKDGKYTDHMTNKPLRKKLDKMLKDIKKDGNELIHLAPGGKLYEELKEKWDRMKATGSTTVSEVYDIEVKGGQNRKTKRKRKSRRK